VFITAALMCPGEDFHSSSGFAGAGTINRVGTGEKQRKIRGQGIGKEMKRGAKLTRGLDGKFRICSGPQMDG